MSFWDNVTKGASDAASYATKKTTELTKTAKIKLAIHSEEEKITDCYREIGQLYYDEKTSETSHTDSIDLYVSTVTESHKKIAELNAHLKELKNERICPECQSKLSKDYTYCPVCGAKL